MSLVINAFAEPRNLIVSTLSNQWIHCETESRPGTSIVCDPETNIAIVSVIPSQITGGDRQQPPRYYDPGRCM